MARRDDRAYPLWVCKGGATPPDRPGRKNPPGGRSFGRGHRWPGPYSPLRGCASRTASSTTKIPCRRTPFNFQTGSKKSLAGFPNAGWGVRLPERSGAFGGDGGKAAVERRRAKIPTGEDFGQRGVWDGLARRSPARGNGNQSGPVSARGEGVKVAIPKGSALWRTGLGWREPQPSKLSC